MKARLQAQRVACGQAGRRGAAAHDLVPHGRCVAGIDEQLDAVLAGVARAADQGLAAEDDPAQRGHAYGQRRVGDRLHDLARDRALYGEHRVGVLTVCDLDVEAVGVRAHPREVRVVVGGVRDRQVAVRTEAVREEVVQHAAVLVAQQRVLRATDRELGDVVGMDALQVGLGVGS